MLSLLTPMDAAYILLADQNNWKEAFKPNFKQQVKALFARI